MAELRPKLFVSTFFKMSVRRSLRSGHSSRLSLNETLLGHGRRRQYFKWTSDLHMKMAKYLSEHYDEYLAALKEEKRMEFVRMMKTGIGGLESLNDRQIDHGFNQLLIKYNFVKAKVNSGGVQPNGTAYKEMILEQCPYFYILDATFAKTPRDITYETDIGNEVTNESDEESSSDDSIVLLDNSAQPKIEIDTVELHEEDKKFSESQLVTPVSPPNYLDLDLKTRSQSVASHVKDEDDNEYVELVTSVSPPNSVDCDLKTRSPSVAGYAKDACKDIGVGNGETKSSIITLIEPIHNKVQDQAEVEKQKFKLEERKFEAEHSIEIKKLDIEYLKVKTQSECQQFAMEKAKNELEFQKFKVQQDNDIKKLRLQIKLEKLKRSSRKTAEDD